MRKRVDEAELPLIGVTVLGRLVAGSTRPEHGVTGGISAIAVGGLLTVVRPQSAGHLPFVREATANDSFTFWELEAIDPKREFIASDIQWPVTECCGQSARHLTGRYSARAVIRNRG